MAAIGPGGPLPGSGRLVVLSRADCPLCDEFLLELQQFAATAGLPPIEIQDVDASTELQRRFGLKVPVLLWDGELIASGRVDRDELTRLFRRR